MKLCPSFFRSFTLIELLLTVSILTILAAAMLPQFIGYTNERNADRAAMFFLSDLMLAKNKALSGAAVLDVNNINIASYWGIRIPNCVGQDYSLGYYTSDNASSFVSVQSKKLPGLFRFSTGCVNDFMFERLTGLLPAEVSILIKHPSDSTKDKSIKIYKSGSYEIQ